MKKYIKNIFIMLVSIFSFIMFSNNDIKAMEYLYQDGNVSNDYNKVKVYSFNYAYITRFTSDTNYYNGVKIKDNNQLLDDVNFYSGSKININYDHYDKLLVEDDDSVRIYKYSLLREDFYSLYKLFDNEKGSFELEEEGIYKIVYVFEDVEKYTNYIFIKKDFHKMEITLDEKYNEVSPTLKLSFNLTIDDGYNLVKNRYYYAFGNSLSDKLNFKEITNMFTSEEIENDNYNNISEKVVVDIASNINGVKRLFIKCIREYDKYEQIVYSEEVDIVNKVLGTIAIIDDNGNTLSDDQFYRSGDTIKFSVKFNVFVKYTNLECFSYGNNTSFSISDSVNEVDRFTFEYLVGDKDLENINIVLRTKGKSGFYALYNDIEIPIELSYSFKAIRDEKAPEILLNITDDNKQIKAVQDIDFTVKESYLSKIYYYVKKCDNVIKDRCSELFDDSKATKIEGSYAANGEYRVNRRVGIFPEERFNEVALAIFVKAVDKIGNETVEVFYYPNEYIVDNVIYDDGINPIVYNEIEDGASFSIVNEESLKINKVLYTIWSDSFENSNECILEDNEFKCASFSGFPFSFEIIVYIEDIYGNEEFYEGNLKYYPLKEETLINGYKFVQVDASKNDYEFTTDVYNTTYDETKKVYFNGEMLKKIEELLSFNIMSITEKKVYFVLKANEKEIVLNDNVTTELSFPMLLEMYGKLKDYEKYAKCSISGNNCDIETFIVYQYKIMENYSQTRKIRVLMKDNTNKYSVEGFVDTIKVGVNENFVDYDFEYVNSLNNKIQKENIDETIEILFNEVRVQNVDTSKVGTYTITRTFISSGVGSYPISYTINVVDEVAPTIKLKTNKNYVMKAGSQLEEIESWVIVNDNYDTNLKIKYSIEPELDINTPGSYVVSIWAVDSYGNESIRVTRTIVVKDKGLSKTTYFVLVGIIAVSLGIIVTFIIIEKKKQKKPN